MDREQLVEAMARAGYEAIEGRKRGWDTAQTWVREQFRAYARAALAVAEPAVRADERLACLNVAHRWTRGGHSATAHGIILGIEERTGGTP